MEKHKLTARQARCIGLKEGDVVEYTLALEHEKHPDNKNNKNIRIAKHVYFNGKRVGGLLSLDS